MLKPASSITVGDPANALMPVAICRSGPAAPPSVMSPGRLRAAMRPTRTADTPKLAALRAKTTAGGPSRSRTAPMAGPRTRERFSTTDCRLLAAARCSSPTTAGVAARAAGS